MKMIWKELGISSKTGFILLIVLYFTIKWAVKNGIKEAHSSTLLKEQLIDAVRKYYLQKEGQNTIIK